MSWGIKMKAQVHKGANYYIALFVDQHRFGRAMGRSMKQRIRFLLLFLLITSQTFHSAYAGSVNYSCFTVSVDEFREKPRQVCTLINQLLQLDYTVYRCAQRKKIGKISLRPGDFIVVMGNSKRKIMFINYLKNKSFVKGRYINLPLEVEAYPLRKGKIAVYDGNYAQDGADLHLRTLWELGFNISFMGDDDLFDQKLIYPKYLAFVLPGLGGDGGTVWYSPGITGKKELQKFVKSGGGIFGTCAGAGLMVQKK